MKFYIKKFIFTLFLISLIIPVFSQELKLKKPGKNEVIFLGKINVVYDGDRDLIPAYRGYTMEEAEETDKIILPVPFNNTLRSASSYSKNKTMVFSANNFFAGLYSLDKDTRSAMFNTIDYYFNGMKPSYVVLPYNISIIVPEEAEAVYLGTFTYYLTGDNFSLVDVEITDEYDLAQEELNRMTGQEYLLYRGNVQIRE